MLKLLNRFKYYFIILGIPYIALMYIFVKQVNYMIDLPGEISSVMSLIEIENKAEEKGSFNTTSVYEMKKCSIFQRFFFDFIDEVEVYETPSYIISMSDIDYSKQGSISHNVSVQLALINGFKAAGETINYYYQGAYVWSITSDTKGLEIGDIVLGSSYDEAFETLNKYNQGEITSFRIIRNDEEIIVSPNSVVGTGLYFDSYVIESTSRKYYVNSSDSGGASGGLLQSLAVFNALTEFDYTFGKKIAGTGTIDALGQVGGIGAIKEKIYTASYNKVDIFFVPSDNYDEALEAYKRTNKKMKLVKVDTIDDAISYLEELK